MDHVNPDRLMKVLSEILSEKYGIKITLTAHLKEQNKNSRAIPTNKDK